MSNFYLANPVPASFSSSGAAAAAAAATVAAAVLATRRRRRLPTLLPFRSAAMPPPPEAGRGPPPPFSVSHTRKSVRSKRGTKKKRERKGSVPLLTDKRISLSLLSSSVKRKRPPLLPFPAGFSSYFSLLSRSLTHCPFPSPLFPLSRAPPIFQEKKSHFTVTSLWMGPWDRDGARAFPGGRRKGDSPPFPPAASVLRKMSCKRKGE